MNCLLIYDIPDDKLRAKVADICLDYGLERIQYSAFFGKMSRNRQGEILLKLRRRIGAHEANVQIFPLCEKDLALRKTIVVRTAPGEPVAEQRREMGKKGNREGDNG